MPSPVPRSATRSTKTNWTRSWKICNRSSWTSRCSRLGACPCRIKCRACQLCQRETVSCHAFSVQRGGCYAKLFILQQSRARRQSLPRTTKKRSCASCRPRWPCKPVCWRELLDTELQGVHLSRLCEGREPGDMGDMRSLGDKSMGSLKGQSSPCLRRVLPNRTGNLFSMIGVGVLGRAALLTCKGQKEGISPYASYLIQDLNLMGGCFLCFA